MKLLKGKVEMGRGEGQHTLREQMPLFSDCFPEVSVCKAATLNILLEKPLVIITPDFTTDPLPWHPAFKVVKGGEVFGFLRIKLTIEGKPTCDAWIYRAQFSPYRHNPFYVEVIAPPINYSGTPNCTIEFSSQAHEGLVVIGDGERGAVANPLGAKSAASG